MRVDTKAAGPLAGPLANIVEKDPHWLNRIFHELDIGPLEIDTVRPFQLPS